MDFCLPLNCIDSFPDNRFENFRPMFHNTVCMLMAGIKCKGFYFYLIGEESSFIISTIFFQCYAQPGYSRNNEPSNCLTQNIVQKGGVVVISRR